jgi:hypothetical protein
MEDRSVSVHVHKCDASQVVREYSEKGYALKERTKSTIPAQDGFVKLIFIPEEDVPVSPTPANPSTKSLWQTLTRQLSPKS